jgi:hypothetical protein
MLRLLMLLMLRRLLLLLRLCTSVLLLLHRLLLLLLTTLVCWVRPRACWMWCRLLGAVLLLLLGWLAAAPVCCKQSLLKCIIKIWVNLMLSAVLL